MTREYSIACTEVLEILKHLPKEERDKIPQDEIDFYEENKATDYAYKFDPSKPIEEQGISKMANAIIITIFRDYFANDTQRKILSEILKENVNKVEAKRKEKYGTEKVFEKPKSQKANSAMPVVKKKKNVFQIILEGIKKFFRR